MDRDHRSVAARGVYPRQIFCHGKSGCSRREEYHCIEREVYGLETSDVKIMPSLRSKFEEDEAKVLASAKKNYSE